MRLLIGLIILITTVFSFEIKTNNNIVIVDIEYYENEYVTSTNYTFKEDVNLMVKFNKEFPEEIKLFEEKYFLELVKVLATGYYIYKTDSNVIDKISEILVDDKNINTIFPAWKRKFEKR